MIKKLILKNFKKFSSLELDFNPDRNILIGDNEAGKSTIIEALDILLSGSRQRVEAIGLETLFNCKTISEFLNSDRSVANLPILRIEVFFDEQNNPTLNGKNNSKNQSLDGLKLECLLENEYFDHAVELLSLKEPIFPFEFYTIRFSTFSGKLYSGRVKGQNYVFLDTQRVSWEFAMRDFVRNSYIERTEIRHRNENLLRYRKIKDEFSSNLSLVEQVDPQGSQSRFMFRATTGSDLTDELTIGNEGIRIENMGKGYQSLLKADFVINKSAGSDSITTFLIEEPENHLSKLNLHKFIEYLQKKDSRSQLFITTHNELICTRLDLRNVLFFRTDSSDVSSLQNVEKDTAEFFMKSSDRNILELVLSPKAILVEGDSEYMLTRGFYKKCYGNFPEKDGINIINVGGISFKRFFDVASILQLKTAAIRDNDNNFTDNCVTNYSKYSGFNFLKVFSEKDNDIWTFEVSIFNNNEAFCTSLFSKVNTNSNKTPLDYMLTHKTECAFKLLSSGIDLNVPNYIVEAFQWIR